MMGGAFMSKLKIGFYWASTCGGCEVAVLDINEKILDTLKIADIVFWPAAIDTKYRDIEAMVDESVDICFFNGSIRNEENERLAKLLRKKSRILIAFGSCTCGGGVPGLDRKSVV
jgi:F420-non-reducing hydrogenase small subunit